MPEHCLTVQSLHGPGAEGNCHTLVYTEQTAPPTILASDLRQVPNLILLGGTPAALWARFYHNNQPVLRCGSANIAIAQAAPQLFGVPEPRGWTLNTCAGPVWLGYDDRGAYYRDRPQRQSSITDPPLWQRVLGASYLSGCYAGDDSDYCLLLLPTPVAQLRPDLPRLRHGSRRALIALYYPARTVADGLLQPEPGSAQLRYFAPQYGVVEDAATGSASVQAAYFLWQRYGKERMAFVQKSVSGGYIETETDGAQVWVRGQARILRSSAAYGPSRESKTGRGHQI